MKDLLVVGDIPTSPIHCFAAGKRKAINPNLEPRTEHFTRSRSPAAWSPGKLRVPWWGWASLMHRGPASPYRSRTQPRTSADISGSPAYQRRSVTHIPESTAPVRRGVADAVFQLGNWNLAVCWLCPLLR